jgi:hypothetical protein
MISRASSIIELVLATMKKLVSPTVVAVNLPSIRGYSIEVKKSTVTKGARPKKKQKISFFCSSFCSAPGDEA